MPIWSADHKMTEGEKETSQAERMALVKFARYTAYTADRMATLLLSLSTQLEEAGVIKANRPSRIERDRRLKKQASEAAKMDQDIAKMMKLIPEHPDAENLIKTLLGDLYTNPEPSVRTDDTETSTGAGEKQNALASIKL